MPTSLVERRLTAILEDATWELCWLGMAQVREVAPNDIQPLRERLLAWAEANGVGVDLGVRESLHAVTLWARLDG